VPEFVMNGMLTSGTNSLFSSFVISWWKTLWMQCFLRGLFEIFRSDWILCLCVLASVFPKSFLFLGGA